ncbi:hypothetical protein BaRGS_00021073 [Batillaria attramentaria]|uniref:Uncharacterized protein n=1 Tax=Batillaria attramentaria TaxID=370345 RepID=A0ABD0KKD6_9CAEN
MPDAFGGNRMTGSSPAAHFHSAPYLSLSKGGDWRVSLVPGATIMGNPHTSCTLTRKQIYRKLGKKSSSGRLTSSEQISAASFNSLYASLFK